MIKSDIKPLSSMTNKTKNHCEICDKVVIGSSYKFKSHLYQHRAVKPRFECSYCFKQYFRSDAFMRHVKVHTGNQKSYVCDYCSRSFVDKRNLIYHLRVHDDSFHYQRASHFKCQACGVSYCEERLLKNHVRKTHFNMQAKEELHLRKTLNETWVENVKDTKICVEMTKVNNNVITIKKCAEQEVVSKESKIQDLSSLYSMTRHYSKAKCDYCNKEMLKKSLCSHIRETHLDVRKFNCDVCNRKFHRHYQLVDHICGKKTRVRRKNGTGQFKQPATLEK